MIALVVAALFMAGALYFPARNHDRNTK